MTAADPAQQLGTVDPGDDRPVYKQIADGLRSRIDDGTFPPGAQLPSEADLERHYATTRTTVRHAISVLKNEGRVRAERGVGVFVRDAIGDDALVRQPYRRFSRRHREAGRSALEVDAGGDGADVRQEVRTIVQSTLPADIAELAGTDTGQLAHFVRRRIWAGSAPTHLADSWFPTRVVDAPPTRDDLAQGTLAWLEAAGHRLTRVTEELGVRVPTEPEARQLRLARGVPVVDLTQVTFAGDVAVECFRAVIAANRYRFEFVLRAD